MPHRFADIAFTGCVKAAQARYGSRAQNERLQRSGEQDGLGDVETSFVAERDSFYMATVSETGWPYVQHRGGPPGFLKVLGPHALAFADFRGNTQLISVGNASSDDRVALLLIDTCRRRRLKVFGRIRFADAALVQPELLGAVASPRYRGRIERVATIEVEAFDWNCPQHITPRFTEDDVRALVQPLRDRISELEARLRARTRRRL